MAISAVFLDRDGVLNQYLPGAYVRSPDELKLLPGVAQAIAKLNAANIPLFVVSNQQGVGKGLMSSSDLDEVDRALKQRISSEGGGHIAQSYYCTALAAVGDARRKPAPGMILEASAEHGIDLSRAAFIGDTAGDMAAAAAAGIPLRILVLTGSIQSYRLGQWDLQPTHVASDLGAAAQCVLEWTP